jgi:pilus assembly protein TadC
MGQWLLAAASAALAAVAVVGLIGSRPSTRRLRSRSRASFSDPPEIARQPPWSQAIRPPGLTGLLRGRLDAPPLRRRVLVASIASTTTAGLLVEVGSVSVWVAGLFLPVGAAIGAVGLGLVEPARSRRRRHRLVMDTPEALDLLAGCLAAGLPPRTATVAVLAAFDGPLADDLAVVVRAVDVGMSDATAWRCLRGHPQLGNAAADLASAVESGSRMVETLGRYAREARRLRAAAVESAAKAVGVRCVLPMMTCFVPSFVLLGVLPSVVSAFLAAVPRVF